MHICICIYIFHIYLKYKEAALRVSNAQSADINTELKHEIPNEGTFILFLSYSKAALSPPFPSISSLLPLALCFRMVVIFGQQA